MKERILEYLAVRQLIEKPRGSILCFVGSPGVGKTSLGRSIAKATGRNRSAVTGRGARRGRNSRASPHLHRRAAGTNHSDDEEVRRRQPAHTARRGRQLGHDFRGDPAAALLEVLDPEQNHTFHDHYLDVEYDLAGHVHRDRERVAHDPHALQDRLEIIRLAGYTEREKMEIAKRHLVKKQADNNGLKEEQVVFTDEGLKTIIENYTREAGVRNLEREIGLIYARSRGNWCKTRRRGGRSSLPPSSSIDGATVKNCSARRSSGRSARWSGTRSDWLTAWQLPRSAET